MVELKIEIGNRNPSNIGFATSLVSEACKCTSEDIAIRTDEGTYVDLKSIMGVLTLNYHRAKTLELQITGEMENYSAMKLKKWIETNLDKYSK